MTEQHEGIYTFMDCPDRECDTGHGIPLCMTDLPLSVVSNVCHLIRARNKCPRGYAR